MSETTISDSLSEARDAVHATAFGRTASCGVDMDGGQAGRRSNEDKPMIEAQQAIIGARDFSSLRPALFGVDVGTVKPRRVFDQLFAAEGQAGGNAHVGGAARVRCAFEETRT